MFACPDCRIQLSRTKGSRGVFWICPSCNGRSATMSLLRKEVPRDIMNNLWQTAKNSNYPRIRKCPACLNRMAEVPAAGKDQIEKLDVCTVCQFVWFDPSEYDAIPKIPQTPTFEDNIPQELKEKIAISKLDLIRSEADARDFASSTPDEWWHWIPGIMGMPVEQDASPVKTYPWITWLLTIIVSAISVWAFSEYKASITQWGFIPSQMWRHGGLTFVTSFFLHAGVMHLIGNMYFFLVFGDNVEDYLGKTRFILLLICATIAGNVLHAMGDPRGTIPCIGASGGISGIVAFYALKFPHVRMKMLFWFFVFIKWLRMPAYALFIIWLLLQFYGSWAQISGFSRVSSLAHLGGAGVGAIFWAITKK